ncbi:hypothetical protein [Novosphingobium sp. UBA1939]|uniref:hypothetical protein n=1 Tax=Novosphingobium sp. UBA1939 TaxID=1946982 RepID=UPI0025FF9BC2|nr:hypothetical protein [Novosphingobium sp. UBA1939]
MRTPSLRELRRACPANVAILPTAATRQVQQHSGRAAERRAHMQAKRELIESQPVAFPFKFPGERERERQAQSLELRADVPPFDPGNPRHLRAWEAIWDFGKRSWPSDGE